ERGGRGTVVKLCSSTDSVSPRPTPGAGIQRKTTRRDRLKFTNMPAIEPADVAITG
ncbi:MAG: hypothetical protein QOH05_2550, partial [Acetobacteraceae bacterium]|nr:hypothetical protein [Acetobacteraceae bacterium]